jgi:hypothetical protein
MTDEWLIVCLAANANEGGPLWWKSNRCGYTSNIGEAGVYTFLEALNATSRDMPVPKEHALRMAARLVDVVNNVKRAEKEARDYANRLSHFEEIY